MTQTSGLSISENYSLNELTLAQKHLTSHLNNLEYTIKDRLNHLDKPIELTELTEKMKPLKNKKSSGLDGISNEMLKHSSPKLRVAILALFNLVLYNFLRSGKRMWFLNKVRSTTQIIIEASQWAVTSENYSALLLMTDYFSLSKNTIF